MSLPQRRGAKSPASGAQALPLGPSRRGLLEALAADPDYLRLKRRIGEPLTPREEDLLSRADSGPDPAGGAE